MARNYEKNFGRLNRLWLERGTEKKAKRPKLSSLKSAAEISEWLPDLKSEINFYLKQIEVPCYTERKIAEYNKHILHLEVEYKAFLRKLRRLDSSISVVPWTPRPYEKRKQSVNVLPELHPIDGLENCTVINLLSTPVLANDSFYQAIVPSESSSSGICQPLEQLHSNGTASSASNLPHQNVEATLVPLGATDQRGKQESLQNNGYINDVSGKYDNNIPLTFHSAKCEELEKKTNVLGLCYSSSDEEI